MSKIEGLAKEYAEGIVDGLSFHHSSPREVGQMVEDAYMDGANTLMSFPLTDRLTAEEKERIKYYYEWYRENAEWNRKKALELDKKEVTLGDSMFIADSLYVYATKMNLLESIFGKDFFKEENI